MKKIIMFPFSGGNKYSYNNFTGFPFEVFEYPGRGKRIKEEFKTNISDLIDTVFLNLKDRFDFEEDYILYGHSMGALVCYLICKKIEKNNLKKPERLILSGMRSPRYKRKKISSLPNSEFWNEIRNLGGIPEELNQHPELINLFIPILKADFKCIEGYEYIENDIKITVPIDVFYGTDEGFSFEEINSWKKETTNSIKVTELKGNHFFIFNHIDFFNKYFKNI